MEVRDVVVVLAGNRLTRSETFRHVVGRCPFCEPSLEDQAGRQPRRLTIAPPHSPTETPTRTP